MTEISNPHDHFFKYLMGQPGAAADFIRDYLPAEVVRLLDLNILDDLEESFVDQDLRAYFSDLLFRTQLRSGDNAFVYILFEHKSRFEGDVAFQLLRYMVKIWEKYSGLRPGLSLIIPVVVYHWEKTWPIDRNFKSLIKPPDDLAPYCPDFEYWLCDLSKYNDDEIKGEALVRIGLLALKYIFRNDMDRGLAVIGELLKGLTGHWTGMKFLEVLIRYLCASADRKWVVELKRTIGESLPRGESNMTTIAEQWIDEGLRKGLQQGLEKGLIEGMEKGMQRGLQQGLQQGLQKGQTVGREDGLRSGLLEGLHLALELKFQQPGLDLFPALLRIQQTSKLSELLAKLKEVQSMEEFSRHCQDALAGRN